MESLTNEILSRWDAVGAYLSFDGARLRDPGMIARLVLQVLLLAGAAYFASAETALFSLSRLDLEKLRRERSRRSEILHELLDQPRRLIISILCGNSMMGIAATANMAGILVSLYGPERAGWLSVLVMVPLLLLFGDLTPKTIAISDPVGVGTRITAVPMTVWIRLVTPLVWALRGVSDVVTTLVVGEEKAAENILQVDEFRTLVDTVAEEGQINATERTLIYNLLEAGGTEVVEIMTPRTQTKFLDAEMSVAEMVQRFRAYQHPRVPVFRVHRDNLVGFVHAEDILRLVLDGADLSALTPDDILHPPVVVPLTKKVDEMFDFFQENRVRAAAVLNEFGGVEGFLTLKDVLTFIFGQISEDIRGRELYRERDDDVYEVPGEMKLTDFNNLSGFGIEDPRMTTVGGVAFRHLDRLPKVGDQIAVEGLVMTVLEMDVHRIARVRVARGRDADADVDPATPESAAGKLAEDESSVDAACPLSAGEEEAAAPEPAVGVERR